MKLMPYPSSFKEGVIFPIVEDMGLEIVQGSRQHLAHLQKIAAEYRAIIETNLEFLRAEISELQQSVTGPSPMPIPSTKVRRVKPANALTFADKADNSQMRRFLGEIKNQAQDGRPEPGPSSPASAPGSQGGMRMLPLYSEGANAVKSELPEAELADHWLAAIVASSDDAIVGIDLKGTITSWNDGAERLYGYLGKEAIGKPITIIIPPDQRDEEANIMARVRAGTRGSPYETIRQRKDGSLVEISLSVSPIKDDSGRIAGASKIARNIAEKRRGEERQSLLLREMNHRVKNLFSVASGIVALSARGARTTEELSQLVQKRLSALARAHELTLPKPSGDAPTRAQGATLHALIKTILLPFESADNEGEKRVSVMGSDLQVGAGSITSFALLLHEFAINAAKYGALSIPEGRIAINCWEKQGRFTLIWSEQGGPPANKEALEEGFGCLMVEATVRHQLRGELAREWTAEGLVLRLTFDSERVAR